MSKEIIIELSRCILVLYENEVQQLPPDIIVRGIGRGKGYQRAKKSREYQAKGFDRWQLYECLKGNRLIDDTIIGFVEHMDEREFREGVMEYLTSIRYTNG